MESKPLYGAGLKALEEGKYKYFRQTDINKTPKMYVNKTCNRIMKRGDFFISRAGTIETYYHNNEEEYVYAGYLIKYPINKKIAISKYIYYWSKGIGYSQIKSLSKTGCTMPKLNPAIAKQIEISIPSLKIQKQIIGIIEPIEKAILKIENAKKIINLMENFLYQKVTKKTSKRKISEIIVEKSKAINSNLTRVVSVGYKGFKEKFGKVSPKSKPLNQWEFVIGLISKDIPKAFNIQKETLGVSTAYKTFSSVDQNVLKIWFIFKKIDVEWQKYLKPVSRQGQGFDSKAFLMADIEMPSNNIFIGNDHLIKKILGIKNNLAILTKKFTTLREDLVYSLIR